MSPVPIFPQHNAEVAQHGQRRRTEAPIPQGFVGSNPTLRTSFSLFGLKPTYLLPLDLLPNFDGLSFMSECSAVQKKKPFSR